MIRYPACGLALHASFPIPELSAITNRSKLNKPTDLVEVSLGRINDPISRLKPAGILFDAGDLEILLKAPGIGRFHMNCGRSIRMELSEGVVSDPARVVLLSSALGAVLHQRAVLALHANALTMGGTHAILLAGQCGSGKSTLAAELVEKGWRSLADDLCAVSVSSSETPLVHPFGPFLRVWSDAVDRLEIDADRLTRARPGLNKWILSLSGQQFHDRSLPISAMVILTRTPNPSGLVARLTGAEAATATARNTYRYHFVEHMNLTSAHFTMAARFAARVPVFRMHCGFPFPQSNQLIDAIHAIQAGNLH